jgi:hypothetical protein
VLLMRWRLFRGNELVGHGRPHDAAERRGPWPFILAKAVPAQSKSNRVLPGAASDEIRCIQPEEKY